MGFSLPSAPCAPCCPATYSTNSTAHYPLQGGIVQKECNTPLPLVVWQCTSQIPLPKALAVWRYQKGVPLPTTLCSFQCSKKVLLSHVHATWQWNKTIALPTPPLMWQCLARVPLPNAPATCKCPTQIPLPIALYSVAALPTSSVACYPVQCGNVPKKFACSLPPCSMGHEFHCHLPPTVPFRSWTANCCCSLAVYRRGFNARCHVVSQCFAGEFGTALCNVAVEVHTLIEKMLVLVFSCDCGWQAEGSRFIRWLAVVGCQYL